MLKPKIKQKIKAVMALTLGISLLCALFVTLNPLEKWNLKLSNHLYDRNEPSDKILIIGIDENSIAPDAMGRWGNWDRAYYADLIQDLEQKGAKAIGFDLFFTEKTEGISTKTFQEILQKNPTLKEYTEITGGYFNAVHPSDQKLADTFEKYDNIYVAENFLLSKEKFEIKEIPLLSVFQNKVKTSSVIFYHDSDEVVRRVPSKIIETSQSKELKSFSIQLAETFKKGSDAFVASHVGFDNQLLINYAAPPYSFKMVSFVDAYNGYLKPEDVKDKIVLIGVITERIQDHLITPTSPDRPMPGVEVHANAIQTLLEGKFLQEQSGFSQILTILFGALALTAAVLVLGMWPGLAAAALAILGYHLSASFFFDRGLILNLVYPPLAFFVAYLASTLYRYTTESRQQTQLRTAFGKYVNKDLVEKIIENPEMLKLGGETRTVTVFFSDIANSTNISEKLTPEQWVAQVNDYFEAMTAVVLRNGGNLNKFEGDAIMAFWGAPLDQPEHAVLAAKTALECRAALAPLNARWAQEGKPQLDFRVGLSTGEVIAGNVGSKERFDYTIMGDIVNLGSRLESANKEYGTHVMVSDQTLAALGGAFEVRKLDLLRVKGKDHAVEVYELLVPKGQLTPTQVTFIAEYHQGLELYRKGQFAEALAAFDRLLQSIPNDGPLQTYKARCKMLQETPPIGLWEGIWTMDHK